MPKYEYRILAHEGEPGCVTTATRSNKIILDALRAARKGMPGDEARAMRAVEDAISRAAAPACEGVPLDNYIYNLGLVFVRYTGTLPGYSKGDNETRFERFVLSVPAPAGLSITPHRVKQAIRRLDAKRNSRFTDDINRQDAAAPLHRPL